MACGSICLTEVFGGPYDAYVIGLLSYSPNDCVYCTPWLFSMASSMREKFFLLRFLRVYRNYFLCLFFSLSQLQVWFGCGKVEKKVCKIFRNSTYSLVVRNSRRNDHSNGRWNVRNWRMMRRLRHSWCHLTSLLIDLWLFLWVRWMNCPRNFPRSDRNCCKWFKN